MTQSYVEKLKTRKRRLYTVAVLLGSLLFLSFIAFALFGESGILVNMRAKREYGDLEAERNQLLLENERLKEEIRGLRTNDRKIEAISRAELGFGRPGEIIFHFPEDAQAPITTWQVDQASPPAPAGDQVP